MTDKEKLALLEDAFELDEGYLTPDMALEDIDEYDSMSKLTLIVLMQDEFNKKLSGAELNKFVTVQDILDFMG